MVFKGSATLDWSDAEREIGQTDTWDKIKSNFQILQNEYEADHDMSKSLNIGCGGSFVWFKLYCDSLEEIRLPDSIREMDSFRCCRSLKHIVIPKGVSEVKGFAFCSSLRTVTLQEGVTKIDDYAFRFCDRLSRINFPEGLKKIGARAFYPSQLYSVTFPKSLEEIGCEAFYYNSALRRIIFNSVVKIDQAAFACTPILKIIQKPKEMTIDDNVFVQDTTLDKYGFWD